jgi:sugar phosphate isomerase/epimerase
VTPAGSAGIVDSHARGEGGPVSPRGPLLSLSHLTILDAAPPDLVLAAADAGFDAVGLRVRPAGDEPAYPMIGDSAMMRETVIRLAGTGVQVLDVEVLRLRPDSRHRDALRILDAGARLGARHVLVIGNDPDEDRLVDRFAAVCEAAQQRGLRACLEFMIFSSVRTLTDASRVVDRAAHPAAAILVDALHLQRSGGTPADVARVPPDRLPYAQVCDGAAVPVRPSEATALAEARTGRLLPGDGELPLRDLVCALPGDASLAVEAPVAALANRPVAERAALARAALTRLLTGRDRTTGAVGFAVDVRSRPTTGRDSRREPR